MSDLIAIYPFYEKIINDYLYKDFCIIDNWLTTDETDKLRPKLEELYQSNYFKKSAVGNRLKENLESTIRSD
ncbi:oxidoreductase, partial [Francisella tularensis subsp. holarctica]|nr:oxidoreductase [Francisella tularensis subsp. holarctica]